MTVNTKAILLAVFIPGFLLGACAVPTDPTPERSQSRIAYAGNRIAILADGNQHDKDDWASTPMMIALLARRGLQSKLVFYAYSNHLGNNSATMASEMTTSALGAADRFGFSRGRFFNEQTELSQAVSSLKAQINASSASNRLYIVAAGPMEQLWRAVKAAEPSARGYVTVISHSVWNNSHADTPQMTHRAADVKALGVVWVQIQQQSALYTSTWTPWGWLKNATPSRLRWVYARMQRTGKPDVSDAGMCYYLLTGDPSTTPSKLRTFFGNTI